MKYLVGFLYLSFAMNAAMSSYLGFTGRNELSERLSDNAIHAAILILLLRPNQTPERKG